MAEIYDTDRFAVLYAASQTPTVENLGLAARYITALFQQNNVPAAFLGGWAVYLRGSGRSTNDVDMTVRCTMPHLIQILKLEPRLSIPQQHGAASIQIFVHTGGNWDPGYAAISVSVDIIIHGDLGAPANLPSGTESINPISTTQGAGVVRVIDLHHQFASKLFAYYSRQAQKDYSDINFLFATNTTMIYNFSHQLNLQHRQFFADVYAFNNSLEPDWITYVREILRL